ncbi:MAG: CRISPR-associated helicase Cas3' [Hyphomicrobiaceae bacterium]|nr:CRISPR-associated helicase Cas3' [Hyphomicrobiaceae bacterium]
MASYLDFWGKAGGASSGQPAWHPVAYHCLDVAAVADALLDRNPRRLTTLAALLGTSSGNAKRFLVCLVALHDVGKFSHHFQAKCPELWAETAGPQLGGWQQPPPISRHDQDGYAVREPLGLRELLNPATKGWSATTFNALWAAVAGHHGQPRNDEDHLPRGFGKPSRSAASDFCRDVRALFGPLAPIAEPEEPQRAFFILSWLVCGLTVIADWIGSNRAWFPYREPKQDVAAYWSYAREKAREAVALAGIVPSALHPQLTPERLLPEIAEKFSSLQRRVCEMPLPDGPSLTIIEDVTGSGKTEAALLLAARLMAEGRARGLFFALPTMATSNAMYDRFADSYRRLFDAAARPSLILAHGRRALNAAFTNSILAETASDDGYVDGNAAACAAWIADDRRKVFLAEVGIGTIDQALLGVLPSRHQALRLWGLSERVLVLDEVHSYDSYMSREMETLLEFHVALGGSAILLSATLPDRQRAALERAFARGLGVQHKPQPAAAYPLLTHVARPGVAIDRLPSREDRTRALPVRRLNTFDEAVDEVAARVAQGCAVAWIRNAVDDAAEAAAALRVRGFDPVLLHARFAMGDRLCIERRVGETLGREGNADARRGFLVVGTQILQESLDYDVDAMVTDLAPVDLIIQRAGRLWRHTDRRDRPLSQPELCVLSPDPAQVQSADWYRQISRRGAAVYGHHGIVWRSAAALFRRGVLDTPGGVRGLIEDVYGPSELDDIPEVLRRASQASIGKDSAARSFANATLLKYDEGYGGCRMLWTADTVTPTRFGDPVTVFRLGRVENGAIVPYYLDPSPNHAWALSEVSLSRRRADGVPVGDAAHERMVAAAKETWPKWEQERPLLVLDHDGEAWRGWVSKDGQAHQQVLYDASVGLGIVTA